MCRRSWRHFFDSWVWTFDPRLVAQRGHSAHIPLDLFKRQAEMLEFIDARVLAREDGLIEKSRDIGFTWCVGGYALHHWLFLPGFKTTFGSRKEEYVDRRGEPDSIFEKMRMILMALPGWLMPDGFSDAHDNHMRLINPANGNTIRGEAGDDVGRGGRCTLLVIDEAAHIEHGDSVDAATSATADTRIWASSVNGMGNTFAKKRHGGSLRQDQIFRFHWRDDPRRDDVWAAAMEAKLEPHVWAAEYEIDYSASVEGVCIPAKWVEASIELGRLLKPDPAPAGIAGLDVGAGKAKSVFVARFGPLVLPPISWGEPDTTETAARALDAAEKAVLLRSDKKQSKVRVLAFDSVGVGAGVQSALKHSTRRGISSVAVNVGAAPSSTFWPDGESSEEKFLNLKAECWWKVRARAKASFEKLLWMRGAKDREGKRLGQDHPVSDCLLLPAPESGPDSQALSSQLSLPKWFRNEKGKIQMETKIQLATRGIASPDHAEALTLTESGIAPMVIADEAVRLSMRPAAR